MEKLSSSGFLEGPILPALTRFSLPILLALILQALYGAVDLWAVGTFCGAADVSAVSTGSQTMLIVTGLVAGLSMGTTVLLGQKIGQNDGRGAARVITTSLWIFLGLAILLSIITVLAAKAIASIMNAPPEAFEKTVHYIRICGAGSIFIVGYNLISAIFRGMGNSKAPLFFVAVACITNIIGDIALIKIFHMGTEGVAIATIAAQAVSVLLSAVMIKRKGLPFPLSRSTIPPDRKTALSVIRLGSPIALQDMCNEISYLILLGFVNALGVTISAGVGIAEKLVMFMLLIPMSYMQAISAFVAQNSGAGQNERAVKNHVDRTLYSHCPGRDHFHIFLFSGRSVVDRLHRRRTGHRRLCRIPESHIHRMFRPFHRLLFYRIFQRPRKDDFCDGSRAMRHLSCENTLRLVCQFPT